MAQDPILLGIQAFSLPFSLQEELSVCLLEPSLALDILNCTEEPDMTQKPTQHNAACCIMS